MGAVVALSHLLDARQVWRGRAELPPAGAQPTGWPLLDAALPTRGWPEAALTEILLPADGIGELQLVLPTLARLTQGQRPVVLIAPPYAPCAMGWRQQGVNLQRVEIVDADEKQQLWATEQCLRSGSCAAVLAWPRQADDRSLRRLQVAADTGRALAFVFRDVRHLANASPAALRLELTAQPQPSIRVRKCRGGVVPAQPISLEQRHAARRASPALPPEPSFPRSQESMLLLDQAATSGNDVARVRPDTSIRMTSSSIRREARRERVLAGWLLSADKSPATAAWIGSESQAGMCHAERPLTLIHVPFARQGERDVSPMALAFPESKGEAMPIFSTASAG
ncbi:translesion DNA synthesis-associated protein ImuA [Dyella jejuensis]|uniref:Translesion DNA synthesis-associated protein ImuA n=1 Tax=Dyella jejuensis TaxID=1432009 RepID=A0ABW8JKZ3_9GAMM